MKILKGCALAFLSFILFFSLCIFGIADTVNQVPLNSHYILKILDDTDFSQIIQESVNEQNSNGNLSPELQSALIDAFRKIQPTVKAELGVAIENTYAYLKGQSSTIDLKETLGNSVMNVDFVGEMLNEIDISQLVDQAVTEYVGTGSPYSGTILSTLITAINKSEPSIKSQIVNASGPIFNYLLAKTSNIDLKSVLRQTIFSDGLISQIISNIDYTTMTQNMITDAIDGKLSEGIELTSQQINRVAAALQPSVTTTMAHASGNFADYLTGSSPNFDITISLTPALPVLKTVVQEAFMAQLPSNLQGLSAIEINNAFEQYYSDFSQTLVTTYELNSSDLSSATGASGKIANTITDVQNGLTDARNSLNKASLDYENQLREVKHYIGYFRLGFACLIALIVVLILGIIFISRNLKDSFRNLGIVFFIYGAGALAAVVFTKYFALQKIAEAHIPQALNNIPGILLSDVLSPLRLVSLICLIGGILLIAASLIYPRLKTSKTE